MKQRLKRLGGLLLTVAVLLGGIGAVTVLVPPDTLRLVGQRAALLSAGLRRPADSVQIIDGWLTRDTAAARPTTSVTVPAVSVGEGSTQPVTAATTTATVAKKEGGVVLTQQMSAGSNFVQGVAIRNKSGLAVDVAKSLAHTPKLSLVRGSTKPQVLITHTHTTECYMSYDTGFYNADDPTRTSDPANNMVAVGERVAEELRAAGIGVIHDTAIHDQPYNTAYSHSKAAVEQYLKQYPSIRVVLDLHRDAIYSNNTTHVKPTAVIDGKKAAQVMIIVGMKNTKAVPNTHTAENLAFGARLQQALHKGYPGLARPMLLADARYNQQLTNGSLLIEMGSDANTLEEACYSGTLLGGTLATLLKELGA